MEIPADVLTWIDKHFPARDRHAAVACVLGAVDHLHQSAEPRLLRCAVLASRGDLTRLKHEVAGLRVDFRDVIVAGEYEERGGELVRVRNLSGPIEDA